jgi:hypothetical protein
MSDNSFFISLLPSITLDEHIVSNYIGFVNRFRGQKPPGRLTGAGAGRPLPPVAGLSPHALRQRLPQVPQTGGMEPPLLEILELLNIGHDLCKVIFCEQATQPLLGQKAGCLPY